MKLNILPQIKSPVVIHVIGCSVKHMIQSESSQVQLASVG
jgi:hypothetical protein